MTKQTTTDLFDIDAHLRSLSGDGNYMSSLKRVTGDTHDVDMSYWKPKNDQIGRCNDNIYKLLQYLANMHAKKDENKYKEIIEINREFEAAYKSLKFNEKSLYMDKKRRWHIGSDFYPEYVVKTHWFALLRDIEKSVNDFLADVLEKNYMKDIDEEDFNKYVETSVVAVNAVFAKHPEFVDIKKIMGCEVSGVVLESFIKLKKYATIIIENYMHPMYDVRKKITKSYEKLDRMFKTTKKIQNMSGDYTKNEDVINVLEKFIIAKYRKEITGNAEHYTKLFMSVIGDEGTGITGTMSGTRLLELLDSIDLDIINNNKNAFKFANTAKDIIRKLVNGDAISAEESIKEVKRLFEDEGEIRVEELEDTENNIL